MAATNNWFFGQPTTPDSDYNPTVPLDVLINCQPLVDILRTFLPMKNIGLLNLKGGERRERTN
jgi:hypothetical protein